VPPHTRKCFLKVKENGVKICVISQGFFNSKVWLEEDCGFYGSRIENRILFDSRNQNNLLLRIFRESLPRTEVSAIGRLDEGRERSFEDFRLGTMIASFQ